MSENDEKPPVFRNQDTLHRRAWIDRALAGVRHRLDSNDPAAGSAHPVPTAAVSERSGPAAVNPPAPGHTGPPTLYLVPDDKRR